MTRSGATGSRGHKWGGAGRVRQVQLYGTTCLIFRGMNTWIVARCYVPGIERDDNALLEKRTAVLA